MFIESCLELDSSIGPTWIQKKLEEKYGIIMTVSGVFRAITRMGLKTTKRPKREREEPVKEDYNPLGGIELVNAVACHLKWPEATSGIIKGEIEALKKTEDFQKSEQHIDKEGRNEKGRFTRQYCQRENILKSRFDPIEEKRKKKNWKSMHLIKDTQDTIARKNLAMLVLPLLTMNGAVRNVNTALGQSMKHCTGVAYKQSTITKHMSELKYLGVSEPLLMGQLPFWQKHWVGQDEDFEAQKLLCFYIDGNTKASWSTKRIKKNKVTMLGRVMGCLEQVFIHDGFGRPLYFETHSGHGPCGEDVLGMFEKIEEAIEWEPFSKISINRVLIMDAASNSVKTLRSFALQQKHHFVTPMDKNQWDERTVNFIGTAVRYEYGQATLREVILELEDSQEKGYLIRTQAIKVDWDHGKTTVLMTSLPIKTIGASEIVRSYFNRWPAQELQFKEMKSAVSLHRVAGYGKQKMTDETVVQRQGYLAERIEKIEKTLAGPLKEISGYENTIAKLIPKERHLRNQSEIKEGKRILPTELMEKLHSYTKEINRCNREIKKIQKAHAKDFQLLKKHQAEWLRLQGKETVGKMDVELDQTMTFYRVSLANIFAHLIKNFFGDEPISMKNLICRIIHLPARIRETSKVREIIFAYNKNDEPMMKKLANAMGKLNALNIIGPQGKRMKFSFGKDCGSCFVNP